MRFDIPEYVGQQMKPNNFSKSEAESVDVTDTLQRTISIIKKEIAKNPTFLQKEIDTRNTNNVIAALIIRKTFNVKSLQQTVSMMRRTTEQIIDQCFFKLGTLTTVEENHSTADTKYSVYLVARIAVISKDRCDSIRN